MSTTTGAGELLPVRLMGFDTMAEVFMMGDRVFRGVYPPYGDIVRSVLRRCQEHDLFRLGIIPTWEAVDSPLSDPSYELLLEHERVPVISYPHEWPAAMLQEAACFHVDLITGLGRHGLTAKDCHPYNVLFRGSEPVMVDFTSVIPLDRLVREPYLQTPRIPFPWRALWDQAAACSHELYARTFQPYFMLPLYLMRQRRYAEARRRMLECTLNASHDHLSRAETLRSARWLAVYAAFTLARRAALALPGRNKRLFWHMVRAEARSLRVAVDHSGYTDYYAAKGEDLPFDPVAAWTPKQRVVFDELQRTNPGSVLDVAANTGWFSRLAARQGCRVVALDIDEACMNLLYTEARLSRHSILPLVGDLTHLTPNVEAVVYSGEGDPGRLGQRTPILVSAVRRLRSDLVLALGLLHHLVLGQGLGLEWVVDLLSELCARTLVLEFVAADDPLVAAEPSFFPAFERAPQSFSWYRLDTLLAVLGRHFGELRVEPGHPEGRWMIVGGR